jgi:hypothetical protein
MAMALNPKLKVIRIMDGSLLDGENMAVITEMAKDKDFQIWIERVEDGSDMAIIIEDGAIVERSVKESTPPENFKRGNNKVKKGA